MRLKIFSPLDWVHTRGHMEAHKEEAHMGVDMGAARNKAGDHT
jgi:hypothetical protein